MEMIGLLFWVGTAVGGFVAVWLACREEAAPAPTAADPKQDLRNWVGE